MNLNGTRGLDKFEFLSHQNNDIVAAFTNPHFEAGLFAFTENGLYRFIIQEQEHLRFCGGDERVQRNLKTHKHAMQQVQAEKKRRGMKLAAPPLSVIEAVANTNDKFKDKLECAFEVLKEEIERRAALRHSPDKIIDPFSEPS